MPVSESPARFYFAVLHAEATVDRPSHLPAVEDSFVLLRADCEEHARDVATAFAQRGSRCRHNAQGEPMRWSHRQVATIYEVLPWASECIENLLDE